MHPPYGVTRKVDQEADRSGRPARNKRVTDAGVAQWLEARDEVKEVDLAVGPHPALTRRGILIVERERRPSIELPLESGDVVARVRVAIAVRPEVVGAEHERDRP